VVMTRFNLGCYEGKNKRHEKAIKHFIIAANLGLDESLRTLKEYFRRGLASKEDYEAALRGHHNKKSAAGGSIRISQFIT